MPTEIAVVRPVADAPSIDRSRCGHCGLPVPAGLIDAADPGPAFCCSACRTVHDLLGARGLDRYYALAGDGGDVSPRRPARVTGKSYREVDDPAFQRVHVRRRDDGLAAISLYLEGVHCTACVWLTERVPALLPGVVSLRLDLPRAQAEVVYDPAAVALSQIARLLDSFGYPVHPWRGLDREAVRRREDRALLIKIGVAGAAAGNVMLMAIALYAGLFADMGAGQVTFFRWASLIVTAPAVAFAASPFFRGAWAALRGGALHLDLPISIGIAAGVGWGAIDTIRGSGEVYFDSIATLVFLLLVARWLQGRHQRKAAAAAELLIALTPTSARRVEADGHVAEVPIEAIAIGDVVEVRAGDTIPVDGGIVEGRSAIDAGLLTGEPRPVTVATGDRVHAGTINVGARLRLVATATGEATRVGQLMQRIEEQSQRRAPIVRFADQVAAIFVPIALGLAGFTILVWSALDLQAGIENAMALLIVTCPCALGLSTPLAISVAVGRAARRGILVKGGDAIERLSRPGLMLLDKTGTITAGQLRLLTWRGDSEAGAVAAALEAHSAHPLARALCAGVDDPAAAGRSVTDVHEVTGAGIGGRVDGIAVLVGAPRFVVARLGRALPAMLERAADDLAAEGMTPVAIAVGGRAVAVAGFGDPIRPDAPAAIEALRRAGWRLGILSGDDPRVVTRVGAALGIAAADCRGGVSPEGKLAAVREALAGGPVVMVGDGINDAAALAAATCGIAVSGSAEAALSAADVFVDAARARAGGGSAVPGLAAVALLVEGAAATMAVIRRNLKFSIVYNLVGATLAVTGLIHPLIGAIMMPLSSLTVVSSSAWSRAFREERP